jgi:hypothetical protein
MWCCFNANTVIEPTKLKPLAAEVPVVTKPVILRFRLPSDDDANIKKKEDVDASIKKNDVVGAVAAVPEDVLEPLSEYGQGEEVPSLDRSECNNPFTIAFAISVLGLLYLLMHESDKSDL